MHPEDQAKLNDMIERARKAVSDFEYEHRLLMPDASVKYLHLTAHGIRDNEGRLEYIGAIQDVTESKAPRAAVVMIAPVNPEQPFTDAPLLVRRGILAHRS